MLKVTQNLSPSNLHDFRGSSVKKLCPVLRVYELHLQYNADGWIGRGWLRGSEFGDFTLEVQLELYRLSYQTTLSARREDGLRYSRGAAA